MGNLSLYDIAAQHRKMVEALMATGDDSQTIADTIEAESYPLEVKAQNVAYAIRNLEATAEAIKAAEKQMSDRRKAIEKRAANISEYLKTCMEIAGISKFECPHFALSIRNNPPSVDIIDEKMIPVFYLVQKPAPDPTPDKAAIKAAIQFGIDVPGAKLGQGTRLDIK
jgi:hypothetical protein